MRRCAVGCCSVWDASQYVIGLLLLSTLMWQHEEQFLLAFICAMSVLVLVNVLCLTFTVVN